MDKTASRLVLLLSVFLAVTLACNRNDQLSDQLSDQRSDQRSLEQPAGQGSTSSAPAAVVPNVDRLTLAKRAIARRDWTRAESLVREQLLETPNDIESLELAGDLNLRAGAWSAAIEKYQLVVATEPNAPVGVRDKLAQAWMRAGQPFEAVAVLEATVRQFPQLAEPRFDLVGLAAMLGLESPAVESLKWLAQHNRGHQEGLVLLAHPSRLEPDADVCESALAKCPSDRRAAYGIARLEANDQRWDQVADRLEPVLKRHPDFIPAVALYGRALVELNDVDRLQAWQSTLPEAVKTSAVYWQAAGRWARRQGNHSAAAKAFWNAVRLDHACNGQTLVDLSTSLQQIGRSQDAERVAERADRIAALQDATNTFFERGSNSQRAAMRVANQMLQLGRIWEAEGWARWSLQLAEERLPDAKQQYLSIRSKLRPNSPWQLADGLVAEAMDLSELPDVAWSRGDAGEPIAVAAKQAGQIRLADRAESLGLNHTCELTPGTETEGMWIYQSVGGGAAVLDFNRDGWPDLTLAMLDGQPMKNDSKPNHLFQNLEGRFRDVTASAGLSDQGFGQGITVGDFNADGFPDILDANIGRNRLYQNNGDGSFRDVTERVAMGRDGAASAQWTTSAVIVDLNGDGHADLYEVNYCAGTEPFEKLCRVQKTGLIASCTPLDFRAQADRVWMGRGDGTFEDVSADWLPQDQAGRGLGLIVGYLDQRPGMDLYLANDMTRNQLWSPDPDGSRFRFSDLATLQGVAVNQRSISQASMGIAAGDPDNDGDLDFFLTHFSDDHNTYYEQVSAGLWQDRSYAVGLGRPSEPLLGFGTEWVDLDNNGSLELMIANGHVSDLRHSGQAFTMPTQVFRRDPDGSFHELDAAGLGQYFTRPHLGRALVTLDANRDGRVDALVTQIHEPVALLINQTQTSAPALGLQLVATRSHRDAIGTTVTLRAGEQRLAFQLTAGDGFMCSNQRRISIGMGDAAEAKEVVIKWPSGLTQTIESLPVGQDYLLVEGADAPFPLHQHPLHPHP